MDKPAVKTCFVICPIGDVGSDVRAWSDDIFNSLLFPIASEFEYQARRAIDEARPGEITTNIIQDIVEADLVIADLTFHNANVFYELALRHARGTPFFHVASIGTKIPFDISVINTVFIDRATIGSIDKTRVELRKHFKLLSNGTVSFDNPVKRHQQKLSAEQSGDPVEKRLVTIEEQLATFARDVREAGAPSMRPARESRFTPWNNQILKQLGDEIVKFLLGHQLKLIFDPTTGRSKTITFLEDGSIGEGRNQNESKWRVSDGRLEILEDSNVVHSRFIFVATTKSFHHTNDPDTRSIKGQSIVLE